MTDRLVLGFFLGGASGVLFALGAPFTRLGIVNGLTPVDMVAIRALVAFVLVFLYLKVSGERLQVPRGARAPLIGLGLSTTMLSVCYLSSVAFIPVGLAVIVFFTFPLLILLVSPVLEKTPFGWRRLIIGLVAFAGLYLAIGPDLAQLDWRGIVLAAGGSAAAVGQFFYNRKIAGQMSGPAIVWGAHFIILPLSVLVSLGFGGRMFSPTGFAEIGTLGIVAIAVVSVGYIGGYLFQVQALKRAPPSYVAPAYNIEPVVSISLAAVMFGEVLSANQYAGGALVLAALILSNMLYWRSGKSAG